MRKGVKKHSVQEAQIQFDLAVAAHQKALAIANQRAGDRAIAREKLMEAKQRAAQEATQQLIALKL